MKKPWLTQYPQGIAVEINAAQYASLTDIFERSCARFAHCGEPDAGRP